MNNELEMMPTGAKVTKPMPVMGKSPKGKSR
jgi:hypothetical protein